MERELFTECYFGNINGEAIRASKKFQPNDPQFVDFCLKTTKQDTIKSGTIQGEENGMVVNFSHLSGSVNSIDVPFNDGNLESDMREFTNSMGSMGFQGKEDFFEKVQSNRNKRKGRDRSELDYQNKTGKEEENGADTSKPNQRTTSARRSRTAEMHNLSERRRRDRINEKLKALQELLPHCSKTDKVSMLDEAIEYLKSLQIQLQMMWMGSGMAPMAMMFPDSEQYMSIMAMDHHHHHHDVTSLPYPKITRPLFADQSKLRSLNASQPVNSTNQTEHFYLHEVSPQVINQSGFGSRTVEEPHFGYRLITDRNSFK